MVLLRWRSELDHRQFEHGNKENLRDAEKACMTAERIFVVTEEIYTDVERI